MTALRQLSIWMQPMSLNEIGLLIGEIFLVSIKEKVAIEDKKASIMLRAERLSHLPADIVESRLKGWTGRYFPSADELYKLIANDTRYKKRLKYKRAIEEQIERFKNPPPPKKPRASGLEVAKKNYEEGSNV